MVIFLVAGEGRYYFILLGCYYQTIVLKVLNDFKAYLFINY